MEPNFFKGKEVLVVGMARSGLAVARYLQRNGVPLTVSEHRCRQELEVEIRDLEALGIRYEVGGHQVKTFLAADYIVVSPGVPLRLPALLQASRQGITILSEVELASWFLRGKIVGITGSNGKTTTTTLVGEMLRAAGFRVQVGGNIGVPLISLVESSDPEMINVVELSSFQLEAAPSFHPQVAVILNITADHMDRYNSLEKYADAKLNLLRNQTEEDFVVLNQEDNLLCRLATPFVSKQYWFSTKALVKRGSYLEKDSLIFCNGGQVERILSTDTIRVKGVHNLENIAAGVTVARLLGAPCEPIRRTVSCFRGVPHRLEWVREIDSIEFYNDSKATNLASTQKALQAFEKGVVLILGGRDKGSDFSVLTELVRQRVKRLVLLGEASRKIGSQLSGTAPLEYASNMDEAVHLAFQGAGRNEVVLLAPACSSFDMFKDYEQRGNVFKQLVNGL